MGHGHAKMTLTGVGAGKNEATRFRSCFNEDHSVLQSTLGPPVYGNPQVLLLMIYAFYELVYTVMVV